MPFEFLSHVSHRKERLVRRQTRARSTRVSRPVFIRGKDTTGRKSGRTRPRNVVEVLTLRSRSGAEGRDRTADTGFFRPVLYQLSYLGLEGFEMLALPHAAPASPRKQ
jgi:hypothetical protein